MTNKKDSTFEENLSALEEIVLKLENGHLPLDEAMKEFENGIKLTRLSQKQLGTAEQRIKILLSENETEELADFPTT